MATEDLGPFTIESAMRRIGELERELAALRIAVEALHPHGGAVIPPSGVPGAAIPRDVATGSLEETLEHPPRDDAQPAPTSKTPAAVTGASDTATKLALFRSRFSGREDAYATRWVSAKTGRKGWGPASAGGYGAKGDQPLDLLPFTDAVLEHHLRRTEPGTKEFHVGLYPMLDGDTCKLLACDFDEHDWRGAARAYVDACTAAGFETLLELSRSGEGAHVWMFFEKPIAAELARSAGMELLRRAMSACPTLSFTSYDRFFPAQDTLPAKSTSRARLGNLIALPLEGDCRSRGTTVFLDAETGTPFADQFAALAVCTPVAVEHLEDFARSAPRRRIGPRDHWDAPPRPRRKKRRAIAGSSGQLVLRRDAVLHVPTAALPGDVLVELKHMASIQNPEFYRRQAQRFSTFGTPRLVTCFETADDELRLPRGLLDEARALLTDAGFEVRVETGERAADGASPASGLRFTGELRPEQLAALTALRDHDTGVLVAPPGAGKTVIACALIAAREVPTAIIVNRADLLAQWRERLTQFLDIEEKRIGQLGAGRRKRKGVIDLIMLQSVSRRESDPSILEEYGQVIIDECHCVAAPSAEAALRQVDVPQWLGLTATPYRADQMDGLITMQCGPIRHQIDDARHSERTVHIHQTRFVTDELGLDGTSIQAIYSEIAADDGRNAQIASDIADEVERERSCLVLTNRLDHLHRLAALLEERINCPVLILHGRLSGPERKAVRAHLAELEASQSQYVLVAMDKVAGEGLDLGSLSALFLAVPISFKGRVIQQVGRVTRGTAEHEPVVHDYLDADVPLLARMHAKRRRVILKQGFVPTEPVVLPPA